MRLNQRIDPTRSPKDYNSEFGELGLEAVRKELLLRRWRPEKLAAARVWVESKDTHSWSAGRSDVPPGDAKKSFRRWAIYVAVALGATYAAARIFRSLF
jgi:hypothetical protein